MGISAQRAGLHSATGLKAWSPARYGSLDIADDTMSYDIFSQAVQAIRRHRPARPAGRSPDRDRHRSLAVRRAPRELSQRRPAPRERRRRHRPARWRRGAADRPGHLSYLRDPAWYTDISDLIGEYTAAGRIPAPLASSLESRITAAERHGTAGHRLAAIVQLAALSVEAGKIGDRAARDGVLRVTTALTTLLATPAR